MLEYHLDLIAGPDSGRTLTIADGQSLVVGRGQASDLQINDPRMSRAHCTLLVDTGKLILRDNGSSGGTFVGQQRVTEHLLQPGEMVKIGDTELRCRLSTGIDATTIGGGHNLGSPPQPQVAPLHKLLGHTLGRFQLDKIISAGNSGMVYQATDTESKQRVAVKVLAPDLAHSEEQQERFLRAMKTMMPIRHPNIVPLLFAGKNGPYCWAAMEYIDGENLAQVISRIGVEGMLDWREAWRVAVHIGRALREAEKHKIIHRNVTPTNIMRRKADKTSVLGDLMLAKALEGTLSAQVTRPGQLIGDLPYMPPERTRQDAPVDCRSDLYGLGATLYALLTGRPPFEGNSLPEVVKQIRSDVPPPPKQFQLGVNDKFQDVVMQLLAKRPEDRYANAGDMLRDVEWVGKLDNLKAD
jgi:pSer/pThr/pTyr-binding forkhead associated (FHA) protein